MLLVLRPQTHRLEHFPPCIIRLPSFASRLARHRLVHISYSRTWISSPGIGGWEERWRDGWMEKSSLNQYTHALSLSHSLFVSVYVACVFGGCGIVGGFVHRRSDGRNYSLQTSWPYLTLPMSMCMMTCSCWLCKVSHRIRPLRALWNLPPCNAYNLSPAIPA